MAGTEFHAKSTGQEVAAALKDQIKGKIGKYRKASVSKFCKDEKW